MPQQMRSIDTGASMNGSPVRLIPARDLKLDPRVNRSIDRAWVVRLARSWDASLTGTLVVVARSDGDLIVVDGQHRYLAALELPDPDFMFRCDVRYGLSRAAEHALFLGNNTRRNVHSIDKFKAAVGAGWARESEIQAEVERHGLTIGMRATPQNIGGVRALTTLHARGGTELIGATLDTILAAWPGDADAFAEEILRGVGELLYRYDGEVDREGLVANMRKSASPGGLRGQAKSIRSMRGHPLWEHVADLLVDLYNLRRRSHKIAPWGA